MLLLTRREQATLLILSVSAVTGMIVNIARHQGQQVTVQVVRPEASRAWETSLESARRLSLNTATADDLQRLPGIGPTLAQRIVAYRAAHGMFTSLDDLRRVSGIGPSRLAQIATYLSL